MSDLISRQAAIELIHTLYPSAPIMRMNRKRWEEKYKPYIEAEKVLEKFPSAQPREGEWIDYSDEGYVECPFCHSATNCDGNKDELHYCFSCGAELRGEQE